MRLVLLVSVVLIALSGSVQAQHYGADGSPSVVDGSIEPAPGTIDRANPLDRLITQR